MMTVSASRSIPFTARVAFHESVRLFGGDLDGENVSAR